MKTQLLFLPGGIEPVLTVPFLKIAQVGFLGSYKLHMCKFSLEFNCYSIQLIKAIMAKKIERIKLINSS